MIVPIKGKVKFSITLDPTVWIFDDRKIILEEAFTTTEVDDKEDDTLKKAAEMFNQEVYGRSLRPPVNKSLKSFERDKVLTHSYVIPIKDFINNCEIEEDASRVIFKTNSDDVIISIDQLQSGLFLFAIDGKPLREDGPVHFYFGDGSNKDDPIKHVKQIIID